MDGPGGNNSWSGNDWNWELRLFYLTKTAFFSLKKILILSMIYGKINAITKIPETVQGL